MNPRQELQALETIIDELLRGIQETIQSGEVLSDELQGLIAEELEITTARIDELYREIEGGSGAPTLEGEPPLEPSMPSSNVHSFGYDPQTGRLLVKFNGKTERDAGPIYGYEGVPEVIFDLFRRGAVPARTDGQNRWGKWWKGKNPSAGASLYTLIKTQGYPYTRLE